MPTERTCAECGAPLPANAPGNRCPKCLLQIGLEETAADRSSAAWQQAPGKAVVLAQPGLLTEQVGTVIGRYKLLQQIGEGGFGVVFMAEQTEPVQRKVALKIIKAGMDTREIIARFEAERQALALMDHPNIAHVLDGGTTATGRPYFVMELVRGMPITDYCDQAGLSTRERLELFIKVCRAVQHAHQKGVIHRDIKPSNVLVTLHDGEPVPKVIDFGVAKALGQKLTDKTLFTRFEQMIGTPAYMSPEQAALSGLDIDTRSDIYSLGVLLYQLLTGVTPLDAETLRQGALDEIRRMICETDPPKPSTRLTNLVAADVRRLTSSSGDKDRASLRRLLQQRKELITAVRGDLDWIAMKALEKDRQRRYETVNGLAADIERYLRVEPVTARPPSALYRIQKMARRHRVAFGAGAAVAIALCVAVAVCYQARHAAQQRLMERRQTALDKALLAAKSGDLDETEKSIAAAELAGVTLGELRLLRGQLAFHRGDYREAIQHLEQAALLSPESVALAACLSVAYSRAGQGNKSEQMLDEMDRLTPKTPEDYLFKGMAESEVDPVRGLATLEQAVRLRPSGIAVMLRAEARVAYVDDLRDPKEAGRATAELHLLQEISPGNPAVISRSLFAQLAAASAYEDAGQASLREAALAEAAAAASVLRQYPTSWDAVFARLTYFRYVGDDAAAFDTLRQVNPQLGLLNHSYALAFYQRGEFAEALAVMERGGRTNAASSDYWRSYILPELPNGPERALNEFRRVWNTRPPVLSALSVQTILRLLGRRAEAVEMSQSLRQEFGQLRAWRNGWYQQVLDYNCDVISDADLLQAASKSKWNQCEAHFYIGLTRLAEGERNAAQEHFRQAIATRVAYFFEYNWSWAFLSRLERDRTWPPWIPAKAEP